MIHNNTIKTIVFALACLIMTACESVPTTPLPKLVPLDGQNTGKANYTGAITITYITRDKVEKLTANGFGQFTRTDNITVTVNFDNNTVVYSGKFGNSSIRLRGDFTEDGSLLGTVVHDSREAYRLNGMVGQDEIRASIVYGRGIMGTSGRIELFRE